MLVVVDEHVVSLARRSGMELRGAALLGLFPVRCHAFPLPPPSGLLPRRDLVDRRDDVSLENSVDDVHSVDDLAEHRVIPPEPEIVAQIHEPLRIAGIVAAGAHADGPANVWYRAQLVTE